MSCSLQSNGPADRASIAPADMIIGDKRGLHARQANRVVLCNRPGIEVPIELVRNHRHVTMDMQLGSVPTAQAAP